MLGRPEKTPPKIGGVGEWSEEARFPGLLLVWCDQKVISGRTFEI
jgi:hypothetical protein